MLKRIMSTVFGLGLTASALAQQHFAIGHSQVTAPTGWREVNKTQDRLVLRSSDGHQQATVSVTNLSADTNFEDFERLCKHRLDAERSELKEGFIEPENPKPSKTKDGFTLVYSGGEKQTGRVFSAYLSLTRRELVTIYVEGIGVPPKDHLDSFKAFVGSLSRD